MLKLKEKILEDRASATIIEYTIVLPLCLVMVVFVLMLGFVLNQKAVFEAAANRSVLLAEKVYYNPLFLSVYQEQDDSEDIVGFTKQADKDAEYASKNSDPYRFWGNGYDNTKIKDKMKSRLLSIVNKNQLFEMSKRIASEPAITMDVDGIIFKEATIKIEQKFNLPLSLGMLELPTICTISASARVSITCPPEMIRNTDFVLDTIERFTGQNITDVLVSFFKRIVTFLDKVEGE